MIRKINFASAAAALILFLLPWLEIQCSDQTLGTQTGIQIIYGGGSPSEELESLSEEGKAGGEEVPRDESLGYAPLVALALAAAAGGAICAFLALFRGDRKAERFSMILPAVALAALLGQLALGFPARHKLFDSMDASPAASDRDPMAESVESLMRASIQVKPTAFFYLELLALGIPTLALANSLVEKYKKP